MPCDRLDALWALGCADRRLETLPAWVDFLVADAETLALIEPQEADRLIALGPHLKELAAKLSDYRLPSTLVHGDLHPGNIAAQHGGYLFYDWTDACIAHPFMDLITVLEETDTLPDQAQATARLRHAYLSQWTDYEPQDRLMEAWSLGRTPGRAAPGDQLPQHLRDTGARHEDGVCQRSEVLGARLLSI